MQVRSITTPIWLPSFHPAASSYRAVERQIQTMCANADMSDSHLRQTISRLNRYHPLALLATIVDTLASSILAVPLLVAESVTLGRIRLLHRSSYTLKTRLRADIKLIRATCTDLFRGLFLSNSCKTREELLDTWSSSSLYGSCFRCAKSGGDLLLQTKDGAVYADTGMIQPLTERTLTNKDHVTVDASCHSKATIEALRAFIYTDQLPSAFHLTSIPEAERHACLVKGMELLIAARDLFVNSAVLDRLQCRFLQWVEFCHHNHLLPQLKRTGDGSHCSAIVDACTAIQVEEYILNQDRELDLIQDIKCLSSLKINMRALQSREAAVKVTQKLFAIMATHCPEIRQVIVVNPVPGVDWDALIEQIQPQILLLRCLTSIGIRSGDDSEFQSEWTFHIPH